MKLAAIDIGSNAMRLLVGEMFEHRDRMQINKLTLVRLPIRLGSDVFDNGFISESKSKDFIQGMKAFDIIQKIHQVDGIRACATSAMRDASNGKELAKKILKKTGIDIEIIDGKKEADLILSTFRLLSLKKDVPYLYIDVGGGSTELSVLINGESMASKSFKIGTVRMLSQSVTPETFDDLVSWVEEVTENFKLQKAIGTGGNINKLIKLCCPASVIEMDRSDLSDLYRAMRVLTPPERMMKWGLRSDRADVIVPASQIFLSIMDHAQLDSIIVPKVGLADGLLYDMYQQKMAEI